MFFQVVGCFSIFFNIFQTWQIIFIEHVSCVLSYSFTRTMFIDIRGNIFISSIALLQKINGIGLILSVCVYEELVVQLLDISY